MNEVDRFIKAAEPEARERLHQVREAIQSAVPDATETIRYGIPTFQLGGRNMIHYGPAKDHVGVYATPDGHAEFEKELSKYKRGKGSVQFSFKEPLPIDLIVRMAVFRSEQLKRGEK